MSARNAVVERFRREVPGLRIRPRVRNGSERRQVVTRPSDARNAIRDDVCHCTLANATKRDLRLPAALVEMTVAYLLEPCDERGTYEVVKYEHDGSGIAKALDLHGVGVVRGLVTLRPPSRFRRVGAQTTAQKARTARKRRNPQTTEHKDKRARGIKQSHRRRVAADIRYTS